MRPAVLASPYPTRADGSRNAPTSLTISSHKMSETPYVGNTSFILVVLVSTKDDPGGAVVDISGLDHPVNDSRWTLQRRATAVKQYKGQRTLAESRTATTSIHR